MTVVTDPIPPEVGNLPPKLTANIVTVSHAHPGHSYIRGIGDEPRLVTRPGEYEIAGTYILGLPTFHDSEGGAARGKNTIFLIELDEIVICHLGDLGHMPNASTIEELGNVDVVLVPVGGTSTIDAHLAVEVVKRLEPKIIIPMHYQLKEIDKRLETSERFLTEMGVKEITPQPKLSVTRSKLPLSPQVVLLDL